MLQLKAVEPGTFSLLIRLMNLPALENCSLVGGTALALHYGHRISVDLDLFCSEKLDKESIKSSLNDSFGTEFQDFGSKAPWAIFCFLQGVKVDIVSYQHPIIHPIVQLDGVRMYHESDILAMKVNAILGRGKKKDFFDLAELLKKYSVKEAIDFFYQKYPTNQIPIAIPNALT
jgi:predicted nucleotidyltransferase component of viral defense system